jgi:hypothetical protein
VDSLSIDAIYGHLLTYEMRLEHNQPSPDISHSLANLFARSPVPRGKGTQSYSRGRGSSYGGRNYSGRGNSSNLRGRVF